jgi:sulfatase modifying factor 1
VRRAVALLALTLAACGGTKVAEPEAPVPAALPPKPPSVALAPAPDAGVENPLPTPLAKPAGPCPDDMAYVDATYCPKPKLRCLSDEYNKPNHITICNRFAPGQTCSGGERRQRFCIDRYEYPNREGAHPPVMVSWYDAEASCAEAGKRLCWQSEWESACEGPEKLPFPYGLERSSAKCNIDNPWLKPDLDKVYSPKPSVADPELLRLDQSVRSGAKADCVSGFGVHDLTGNFDEWILSEENRGKSQWAGLKGGAWGHVRNACRPMTTSHPPEFTYYFISFRCCEDAAGESAPGYWTHPPAIDRPKPGGKPSTGWTPRGDAVRP